MCTCSNLLFWFVPFDFSDRSLNSLNCSDLRSCNTERSVFHTPPNQDGRATPSPEHVASGDSEEMNNFDVKHSSLLGGNRNDFSSRGWESSTKPSKNTKEAEHCDENFNSFYYWRSPLPDISGELEMLNCPKSSDIAENTEEEEEEEESSQNSISGSTPTPGKATSDQIQKVLDCLQPHIDDPDVQGGYTEPDRPQSAIRLLSYSLCRVREFTSSTSPGALGGLESSPARQPDRCT